AMSRHVGPVHVVERPVLPDDHDHVLDGSRRVNSMALIGAAATSAIILAPLVALVPLPRVGACGSAKTADERCQRDRDYCVCPDVFFHRRLLSTETTRLSTAGVVGVAAR